MIKKHIKIAVEIPSTDKDNKLIIEPGRGSVVVLSDSSGLKIGVDREDLINAIYEIGYMKQTLLPAETEEPVVAPVGEIIEGDEE